MQYLTSLIENGLFRADRYLGQIKLLIQSVITSINIFSPFLSSSACLLIGEIGFKARSNVDTKQRGDFAKKNRHYEHNTSLADIDGF